MEDESKALKLVNWIVDSATDGVPTMKSAKALAEEYLSDNGYDSNDSRAESLINWESSKNFTTGFITGLGGYLTLPISIPSALGASWFIQARMAGAIAMIYGHDIVNDRVRSFVLMSLLGDACKEVLKEVGLKLTTKVTEKILMSIPGRLLIEINKQVGFRLLTKAGEKGVINLIRGIPIAGGAVSGGVDAITCKGVGNTAIVIFRRYTQINEGENTMFEKLGATLLAGVTSVSPAETAPSKPKNPKQASTGDSPMANLDEDERYLYATGVSRIFFNGEGEEIEHLSKWERTAWCRFLKTVGIEVPKDPDDGTPLAACRIAGEAKSLDLKGFAAIIELLHRNRLQIKFLQDQIELGFANSKSDAFPPHNTVDEEGSETRDALMMFYTTLGFPSDKFDDLLKKPRGWAPETPKEMENEKKGEATNTPSTVGKTPAKPELALGQMGVTLGFITTDDLNNAFEEQKVDEAIGQKKPLCGYLFETGKLTKAQIAKMISSTEKA